MTDRNFTIVAVIAGTLIGAMLVAAIVVDWWRA